MIRLTFETLGLLAFLATVAAIAASPVLFH